MTESEKIQDPSFYSKALQLLGVALYCFPAADEELAKYSFMVATKKGGKKYIGATSHGIFDSDGKPPRSGEEVARIIKTIASFGDEGNGGKSWKNKRKN